MSTQRPASFEKRERDRVREREREERPQAFDGCLRSLAVGKEASLKKAGKEASLKLAFSKAGKEASLKLGGPRPLFEGYGPQGRQKGVQQQEKKQVSS